MNKNETTFQEVMESPWLKDAPYDGGGPGAIMGEDGDTIFVFPTVWDEFLPLSHSLNTKDTLKLYNVLFYSRDMYNFLKESNDPRAKEILEKIETDEAFPTDH